MKERIENFYKAFDEILSKYNNPLLADFNVMIQEKNPQQVFLWLDEKYRNAELPKEIEPLLTDFFGWVH